jgi:hypothetical protein
LITTGLNRRRNCESSSARPSIEARATASRPPSSGSAGIAGLGLKKIYLNTLETDVRNIRLNEELGFKVEGILRNECFFDGEYHDILRMALLVE